MPYYDIICLMATVTWVVGKGVSLAQCDQEQILQEQDNVDDDLIRWAHSSPAC